MTAGGGNSICTKRSRRSVGQAEASHCASERFSSDLAALDSCATASLDLPTYTPRTVLEDVVGAPIGILRSGRILCLVSEGLGGRSMGGGRSSFLGGRGSGFQRAIRTPPRRLRIGLGTGILLLYSWSTSMIVGWRVQSRHLDAFTIASSSVLVPEGLCLRCWLLRDELPSRRPKNHHFGGLSVRPHHLGSPAEQTTLSWPLTPLTSALETRPLQTPRRLRRFTSQVPSDAQRPHAACRNRTPSRAAGKCHRYMLSLLLHTRGFPAKPSLTLTLWTPFVL